MYEIIEIDTFNINLLKEFIDNKLPDTFRYFNKRNLKCIENHILTIIILENKKTIGYAHIDYDKKYWLGICILQDYQSKGYGTKIMDYIFNHKKIEKIKEIFLSVDVNNNKAIILYNKYNFNIVEKNNLYYIMKKNII